MAVVPRFLTQWNHDHKVMVHECGDRDEAIPDLTYSIKQLREKFVLESEILRGRVSRPGQFMFNQELNDDEIEQAFDAPPAEVPQNYDFVDADADTLALRRAVVRLQQSRISAGNPAPQVGSEAGGNETDVDPEPSSE